MHLGSDPITFSSAALPSRLSGLPWLAFLSSFTTTPRVHAGHRWPAAMGSRVCIAGLRSPPRHIDAKIFPFLLFFCYFCDFVILRNFFFHALHLKHAWQSPSFVCSPASFSAPQQVPPFLLSVATPFPAFFPALNARCGPVLLGLFFTFFERNNLANTSVHRLPSADPCPLQPRSFPPGAVPLSLPHLPCSKNRH